MVLGYVDRAIGFVVQRVRALLARLAGTGEDEQAEPDERTEEEKLQAVNAATDRVKQQASAEDAIADSIQASLPEIKREFRLVDLTFTVIEGSRYNIHAAINPEDDETVELEGMSAEDAHRQAVAATGRPELFKGHGAYAGGRLGHGFSPEEREEVDEIGYGTDIDPTSGRRINGTGDHSYPSIKDPGTIKTEKNKRTTSYKEGRGCWIPDHQPPNSVVKGGAGENIEFRFYPHSLISQNLQRNAVNRYKNEMMKLRNKDDKHWAEDLKSEWFW